MTKHLDLAGLTAYDKKIKEYFKSGLVDITDDAISALFVTVAEGPADNEIWYTTSDGNVVNPYYTTGFGANLINNTYEDGKGILKFDNSVTNIGSQAFQDCSSLTSITIPNSVTSIGYNAFWNCSSLTSVAIPNSVRSIGDYAFYNCSGLTSITIPNSVTKINAFAFSNCSGLTKTNYTGDIAGWCNIKFSGSDANPIYYSHNFYINDQEIKDLVIPNSVDTINKYAFYNCKSLTSITFEGTMEDWNAITKGSYWKSNVTVTYVQCTDGQVAL